MLADMVATSSDMERIDGRGLGKSAKKRSGRAVLCLIAKGATQQTTVQEKVTAMTVGLQTALMRT
jgi:hypothetical protein